MLIQARVKRDMYFDSITLMKMARFLTEMDGIDDAAAIMATEPNLQLLGEAGLTPFEGNAESVGSVGPADVLIVVRASDETSAEAALDAAEKQLAQRPATNHVGSPGAPMAQPRSLEQAVQLHPEASVAAISVPGPYAALEAERALRAGLHVFLFSDNVPLEQEIALKRLAQERGLLLMGPDCGTAMLNGVGLGFVNVVPRGPIGIVGASGTGIQQVMSLIAQQGSGISQAIGCGGRDLSEAVAATTTLQGLRLLQEDEQTRVIVLISKPPAPAIAEHVLEVAAAGGKPVVVIFVGADHDALQERYGSQVVITRTLAEAAQQAVYICEMGHPMATGQGSPADSVPQWLPLPSTQEGNIVIAHLEGGTPGMSSRPVAGEQGSAMSSLRLSALFSGGTLCDEAMHIWVERLGPIYSNIPLDPAWRLAKGQRAQGHIAIDFGDDEYTRGRPHPMIDPSLRLKCFQEEADDPQVGVILLDIVLGYCAHPDPASVYAPAILKARDEAISVGRLLTCVISLCGTEDDPQRLSVQSARFREAGAEVFTSNADAALRCIEALS